MVSLLVSFVVVASSPFLVVFLVVFLAPVAAAAAAAAALSSTAANEGQCMVREALLLPLPLPLPLSMGSANEPANNAHSLSLIFNPAACNTSRTSAGLALSFLIFFAKVADKP